MGKVIPRSASPERIYKDFHESIKHGKKKGGDVGQAVDTRLGPLAAGVLKAEADVKADREVVDDLDDSLTLVDGDSDLTIGATLDESWNALGRPASSIEYTLIAGQGKAQWTDGDPRKQPTLMTILAARFRQSTAAALQSGKEDWALRIEAKAVPHQKAATALDAAEAKLAVSAGIARAVADLTQVALARLKRDLKNIGLTEVQIHEVIPDYEPKSKDGEEETTTNGQAAPAAPPAPTATPATPTP